MTQIRVGRKALAVVTICALMLVPSLLLVGAWVSPAGGRTNSVALGAAAPGGAAVQGSTVTLPLHSGTGSRALTRMEGSPSTAPGPMTSSSASPPLYEPGAVVASVNVGSEPEGVA